MGIPNILNLYRSASIISTAVFIATNSDPNVDVSTVDCAFEYQIIGAEFRYIRITV